MIPKGKHVLVDTNVIIEAHRIQCWKALLGYYLMDTVGRCVEECATGNQRRNNPVPIDPTMLMKDLSPKTVTPEMVILLEQKLAGRLDLDPGEKELIAYALTLQDAWIITSPDKAAVRAGKMLNFLDRFTTLEELNISMGRKINMRDNFTNAWLIRFRTQLLLEQDNL